MSKYHAKRIYMYDRWFASKAEAARYQELKLLEAAGEISDLQTQVTFELLPGFRDPEGHKHLPTKYIADFVYRQNGRTIVEDKKGFRTDVFKLKKKLMWIKHGVWVKET